MSDHVRLKRRRAHLMAEDPHCRNCGRVVVWYPPRYRETLPLNFATIEHVNSRNQMQPDPVTGRLTRPPHGRWELWCRGCNEARGAAELAAKRAEDLWQESGRWPGGPALPDGSR